MRISDGQLPDLLKRTGMIDRLFVYYGDYSMTKIVWMQFRAFEAAGRNGQIQTRAAVVNAGKGNTTEEAVLQLTLYAPNKECRLKGEFPVKWRREI